MREGDVVLIVCATQFMQNDNGYAGLMQKGQVAIVGKMYSDASSFKVSTERFQSSCWLYKDYAKVLKVR